jgi:hypothetical protein
LVRPFTYCDTEPTLEEPIKDPAQFPWHEVKKVEYYSLKVDAIYGLRLKEEFIKPQASK